MLKAIFPSDWKRKSKWRKSGIFILISTWWSRNWKQRRFYRQTLFPMFPTNSKLPSVLLRVMQVCCRMMTCLYQKSRSSTSVKSFLTPEGFPTWQEISYCCPKSNTSRSRPVRTGTVWMSRSDNPLLWWNRNGQKKKLNLMWTWWMWSILETKISSVMYGTICFPMLSNSVPVVVRSISGWCRKEKRSVFP